MTIRSAKFLHSAVILLVLAFGLSILFLDSIDGEQIRTEQQKLRRDFDKEHDDTTRRRLSSNIFSRINSNLVVSNTPYYITNNDPALFPRENYDITIGNPLKGLTANPGNINPKVWPTTLPASLGAYKLPLSSFMLDDPDIVGEELAFNWTYMESQLQLTSNYSLHAIIRFWIYYPGQPLRVPAYLFDPPYNLTLIQNNTLLYYDDPVLKKAINQTIQAFGRRYDGDPRIFMLQAGFFGAWGEWHTQGCKTKLPNGTTVDCFPSSTAEEAVPWFRAAFKKTHVQFRYPDRTIAAKLGFGYHDDSFTYLTLGGIYNGNNTNTKWFFWNISISSNVTDFYKKGPMGGEVRPENSDVFTDTFPAYTNLHQDFNPCSNITHTTYMLWGRGWTLNNGIRGVTGAELQRARNATVRMGYSFEIDAVAVAESLLGPSAVDVSVTIKQTGVAPFYYNLNVSLYCNGGIRYATTPVAVETLLDRGNTTTSVLRNVPATPSCLTAIEFRLESTYLFPNRRIRWAQGNNNGTVIISIPSVPTASPSAAPSILPSTRPSKTPSLRPSSTPSNRPSLMPSLWPSNKPSFVPSYRPSDIPSARPSFMPSSPPTGRPTSRPTLAPTRFPTTAPTRRPTRTPTQAPTPPPYWSVDLYFVNITSQQIMHNVGPIKDRAVYKSTLIGRNLGILAFTNRTATSFNYSWPVNKFKFDTIYPFFMGLRNGTLYRSITYLSNNGAKNLTLDIFVGTRRVSRTFVNFAVIT